MLLNVIAIVIGYFLGSIPSAYIIARFRRGIDIRDVGVGNMGAANAFREIGVGEGIVALIADMAKGAVAILTAQYLNVTELWVLGAGFAALLGHNFPVFLGFKGGIGSAVAMGIFLLLAPREMGIAFGIMAVPLLMTRNAHNVALAISIGFIFIPLLIWLLQDSAVLVFYSLAIIVFIGFRSMPAPQEFRAALARLTKRNTNNHDSDDN